MTTTDKSASNGSKPTMPSKSERKTGMAYVREVTAYHVASVAHSAASEAERMCDDVYRTASDAYFGRDDSAEAVQALTSPEIQRKVREAFDCLDAAQEHLRHLMACDEPPF
jgi:hypothetical protein